jgi:voltage-gated potassium channel Kch
MSKPQKIGLRKRFKYAFDNTMSAGTIAIIGWLGILSAILVIIAGIVIVSAGITQSDGEKMSIYNAMWESLMRTMDSGNVAGDSSWGMRAVMIIVTLGGIFLVSTLIAILGNGVQAKIEEMRKGRSFVIEKNHTLILGWSSKIFTIISELTIANENQKKPRIVVLADKDKVEMEDEIRIKVPNTRNTKIIVRSGNPVDIDDLGVANPNAAKSIIIVPPDHDEDADIHTLKSILAVVNNPNRKEDAYHIVAEIKNERHLETAAMIGKDELVIVNSPDMIARMTVQTCRQIGLSGVYSELLQFDGDEIYFQEEPKLTGKTFADAIMAYESSSIIGMRFNDGQIKINPPMDTAIKAGDKVIAISEDDDTVILSAKTNISIQIDAYANKELPAPHKEHTLILGWNAAGDNIVKELETYVIEGSTVKIVSSDDSFTQHLEKMKNGLDKLTLVHETLDITERYELEHLNVTQFDYIILLSEGGVDVQKSDAKTLITLLHIRDICSKAGKTLNLVSEMLDVHNMELAKASKDSDFIISDKLISLMLTMLSENKELKAVFDDLFSAEGSEIYLKPSGLYVQPNVEVNFYTIVESAKRFGHIAIGYRIEALSANPDEHYGIKVNPNKSTMISFTENDKIIVVAED